MAGCSSRRYTCWSKGKAAAAVAGSTARCPAVCSHHTSIRQAGSAVAPLLLLVLLLLLLLGFLLALLRLAGRQAAVALARNLQARRLHGKRELNCRPMLQNLMTCLAPCRRPGPSHHAQPPAWPTHCRPPHLHAVSRGGALHAGSLPAFAGRLGRWGGGRQGAGGTARGWGGAAASRGG